MRKQGLYSAASPKPSGLTAAAPSHPIPAAVAQPLMQVPPVVRRRPAGANWAFALFLLFLLVLAASLIGAPRAPAPQAFDQAAFDESFNRAMLKRDKEIGVAPAYAAIAQSLVRIRSVKRADAERGGAGKLREGVGTGVVIVDTGVILTALHVVDEMDQVLVRFHDGSESPAFIVSKRPEQDLAVLRVGRVPEELVAARLASSADLRSGDAVMTVGFPFGFGPSVSAGVVSGLNREFFARQGQAPLRRLIQFDAAVNPGNSGGPLLNMAGEVVGIVVAIFNPIQQGFFVGLGFAVPIENAASAAGVVPF